MRRLGSSSTPEQSEASRRYVRPCFNEDFLVPVIRYDDKSNLRAKALFPLTAPEGCSPPVRGRHGDRTMVQAGC